ncbi:MAG: N-6 DNA methylase, partial [Phototrophicaceae bacterium]
MPTKDQARQALNALIKQYEVDRNQKLTESDVIEKYLLPLFRDVLGWPTDYEHFKNEVTVSGGRVDRVLLADNGERIYVEAKRFNVIDALETIESERYMGEIRRAEEVKLRRLNDALGPQQLALPSMAVDRTKEEQQAINYAFQNGGQWAILANFERLRLFNARRDWLVLSFESPAAYLQDFELLWQLSYDSILDGSLDYLSNQRYRADIDTQYLALIDTWRVELANDLLKNRASNAWIFDAKQALILPEIRNVVQRIIDRMVVVRFAEDHIVIPPGTLNSFYEMRRDNPYTHTMVEMIQQFFRKFDEVHNSALFSTHTVDQAIFSDEVLMRLVYDLYLVKFRAMPADILGNTYEQYLGKALVVDDDAIITRDNLETRKKQGSYYTPQVIVRYIVDNSLGRYLYGTDNGKADGTPLEGETRKNSRDMMDLRVLDSACGSGSFLIYAYEVLREFYESEIARLEADYRQGVADLAAKFESATLEDNVRVKQLEIERDRLRNYPRMILEQHLYGVDLDPQAAEIAVVNLMMRAMEKQGTEKRLPLILNQNVKVGNALIGVRPDDTRMNAHQTHLATIRTLRADLKATSNVDPAHDRILDDLEQTLLTVRTALDADFAVHFTDLERVRPFHWGVEFPEVFFDKDGTPLENAGFQVIIGNPPWEIVKPDLREYYAQFDEDIESRLSRAKAEARIAELNAHDPDLETQWQAQRTNIEAQAQYYRATDDYTRQGRGDTATHKLFVERVYGLLQAKGRLGYVVPSGIYTDLGTKDLRQMFLNEGSIEYIYSFSNERFFFAGVDHRFKFALIG